MDKVSVYYCNLTFRWVVCIPSANFLRWFDYEEDARALESSLRK